MSDTDEIIVRLLRNAPPVRRLRPPLVRAILWLASFAAVSAAGIALFADMRVFHDRMVTWRCRWSFSARWQPACWP